MKYKYTWQEVHNAFQAAPDYANAHLLIISDSGDLIFEEEYIPLLDLVNGIENWEESSYTEYSPDDYEQNPLLSLRIAQNKVYIETPDTREAGKSVVVTKSEFREFYRSFCKDVKKDIEEMLSSKRG